MKSTSTLEQFEQLVLAAVATLEDAYGVTIHDKVEEFSGRPQQFGPIYSTLTRLQNKGYISSWIAEGSAQRAGRPKRNYKIEPSGEEALKNSARTANRMYTAVKTKLEIPYGTEPATGNSDIQ